jgi:hypothetical protein
MAIPGDWAGSVKLGDFYFTRFGFATSRLGMN